MRFHASCFLFLLLFCLILQNNYAYKILVVAPMPAKSHHFLMSSLAKGLADAGHDVTIADAFPENYVPRNKNGSYTLIPLDGMAQAPEENPTDKEPNFFDFADVSAIIGIIVTGFFARLNAEMTLEHSNFQKLLKSNAKFDVVILEHFDNDALKGIAHYYDAPLMLLSTIPPTGWTNPMTGNPSPPSYIPELWTSYSTPMSFLERVSNTLLRIEFDIYTNFYSIPKNNAIMKKFFPDAPDLRVLYHNVSLMFVNAHDSINQAVPYVPNMIQIGGFHINPSKKLPEDLQKYLDNAKDGVIYFSLGSNLKPSQMRPDIKQAFIEALGKLKKYKVLWKFDEELENLPSNIKISKWFPQQEVLAHPNVKLFMTHGGSLSTTETIYHGVPILVISIFGDQHVNGIKAESSGYGLSLPYLQVTEEKLNEKLNDLLNNPKYKENVKTRSAYFHERPVKPMDLVVFWTEFVAKHRGAPHLRISGVDLPFYQYFLFDVIAFLLFVMFVGVFSLYLLVTKVCCRKRKQKVKTN